MLTGTGYMEADRSVLLTMTKTSHQNARMHPYNGSANIALKVAATKKTYMHTMKDMKTHKFLFFAE